MIMALVRILCCIELPHNISTEKIHLKRIFGIVSLLSD